ncbi:hypothetical protein F5X99DRAFT_391510 [Biscogniauxia marginata]|nr:hypothetical protein F5X99DRAFT_391510 [Biscogniauxia marginata]
MKNMMAILRGFKTMFLQQSDQKTECPSSRVSEPYLQAHEPLTGDSLFQFEALLYNQNFNSYLDYPDHCIHSDHGRISRMQKKKRRDTAEQPPRITGSIPSHQQLSSGEGPEENQESKRPLSKDPDEDYNLIRDVIQPAETCHEPVGQQEPATTEQENAQSNNGSRNEAQYGEATASGTASTGSMTRKANILTVNQKVENAVGEQEKLHTTASIIIPKLRKKGSAIPTTNRQMRRPKPEQQPSERKMPPHIVDQNTIPECATSSNNDEENNRAIPEQAPENSYENLATSPSVVTFEKRHIRRHPNQQQHRRYKSLLAQELCEEDKRTDSCGSDAARADDEEEGGDLEREALLARQEAMSQAQKRDMEILVQEGRKTALSPYVILDSSRPERPQDESAYLWNNPVPEARYGKVLRDEIPE